MKYVTVFMNKSTKVQQEFGGRNDLNVEVGMRKGEKQSVERIEHGAESRARRAERMAHGAESRALKECGSRNAEGGRKFSQISGLLNSFFLKMECDAILY